jgi:REP element-mobilizing transposase RayT
MQEFGRRLHHKTPGWVESGSRFHIRLRAAKEQSVSLTDPRLAPDLIAAARRYHDSGRWWCEFLLLMPDHIHAIISFPRAISMSATVRDWKRGTARFQRVQWQENFFDHRIRNEAEFAETWRYIRRNPVAKDLCREEEAWPWWWTPSDER